MSDRFKAKKHDILKRLDVSDDEYADASPKGSIDANIRRLVNEINRVSGFVTTSSCSGRIAVFLEGPPTLAVLNSCKGEEGAFNDDRASRAITVSNGGKRGGRWLFTSHEPVDLEPNFDQSATFTRLGFSSHEEVSPPQSTARPQYVHFKFEPMILHILAESANEAQLALNAAIAAGFRESGISALFDSKGRPSNPMVAVRSSGLAIESIVGFQTSDSESPAISPMVSESYLRTLVQLANDRFKVNAQRMERFRHAFLDQLGGLETSVSDFPLEDCQQWEPMEVRKKRMRREGLSRQELLRASAETSNGTNGEQGISVDQDGMDDSFGLDLFSSNNAKQVSQEP